MTYVVIAEWTARHDTAERVSGYLAELADCSMREPGCLAYRVHRSLEDATAFLLYEEYESPQASEAHLRSEHFKRLAIEGGIPLLAERVRRVYEPLGGLN